MKVVKNLFWSIGYQILILIVPLITIPYVSRSLGPVGVGVEAYANGIAQYFVLISGFGVMLYGTREVAYVRDDKEKLNQVFWELSILRLIIAGCCFILYCLLISRMHKYFLPLLCEGLIILETGIDISWLFQGLEKFNVLVIRNTLVKLIGVVLIFLLVKEQGDVVTYILILTGTQLVGYLSFWPYVRNIIHPVNIFKLNISKHIRSCVLLLIPQIAVQLYLPINKTMLGSIVNVAAAGYYNYSDNIIKMVLAVITAIGNVMMPHASHRISNNSIDLKVESMKLTNTIGMISSLTVPLMVGLMLLAEPFTTLFFGPKFTDVAGLMKIEAIVVVIIGFSNTIGMQYLLPFKKAKSYSTSVIVGSAGNAIINLVLIPFYGAVGAMIGTVFSELIILVYQLIVVRKMLIYKRLFDDLTKYVVAVIVMLFTIKLIMYTLGEGLFAIVVSVVAGAIVYFGLLIILRPNSLRTALSFVHKHSHP